MKAILLAAGRGERMRPLTDHTPKPLLKLHGKPLIEWHLEALARAGVKDVVINTAWLEEQIITALGHGARFGLRIAYSCEGRDHGGALETAGGLKKALPLLTAGGDSGAFWYLAADAYLPGFDFAARRVEAFEASALLGQLWMVANPPQHPDGDFGIDADLACVGMPGERFTWSGLALFKPAFVTALMGDLAVGQKAKLRPCLDEAIAQRRLGAQRLATPWADVGTPERLAALNAAPA
jgi:N-acetyl-alpha-D-muramate 1-phosphate uridylyltransferase